MQLNVKKHWPKMKVFLGKSFERMSYGAVPLGIGLMVGFYLADRGLPWLPTALEIVLALFILGFLAWPLGRFLQGQAYKETAEKIQIRKRIKIAGGLTIVVVFIQLFLFWVETPSPLTQLSKPDYHAAYKIDLNQFKALSRDLANIALFVKNNPDLGSAQMPPEGTVLSPSAENQLLEAWQSVYNNAFVLDQIRIFHEDWFRFDPSRNERAFHLKSFLISFAIELAVYKNCLAIVSSIKQNKNAVKFLNSPHPNFGLEKNSFNKFVQELLGNRELTRIAAAKSYLKFLDKAFDSRHEAEAAGIGWLVSEIDRNLAALDNMGAFDKIKISLSADTNVIQQQLRRNWFFTQTSVAKWMGDTKFRRINQYLIGEKLQQQAEQKLQPGDILLARKNWYLSNVGLPGFWPHAILYVGDLAKFSSYFDDPAVQGLIREISGKDQSLAGYLESAHPGAFAGYVQQNEGQQNTVIEAVGEGVLFNTLAHVTGDYFAAMRPNLGKRAKAQAIIEAFSHFGKPYDFDFDFATDHTLVCTELVWRSLRSGPGKDGIDIPLVDVMGRKTLPANEIAGFYNAQKTNDQPALSFVLFFDANEHEHKAFEATESDFAATFNRTKWDLKLP